MGDLVKGNGNGGKPDKEVKDAKLNGNGHSKDEEPPIETSEDPEPEEPEDPEDPEEPEDPVTTT